MKDKFSEASSLVYLDHNVDVTKHWVYFTAKKKLGLELFFDLFNV